MIPFVKGDPTEDFWKQNPEIKTISPFSDIVNKKDSSLVMWAIYFIEDPKSVYNRYPIEERIQKVEDNYIKGKFKLSTYKKYLEAYPDACLTSTERAYKMWQKEVKDFNDYYEATPYNEKNTDLKMKMLDKKEKIWSSLIKAEQEASEEHQYRVEGNRIESLIELEEI